MSGPEYPRWFCENQEDLLALVESEHIAGSMPADDAEFQAQRQAFYAELMRKTHPPGEAP